MADLEQRIADELDEVRRLRDELRVRIHLGKAEVKERWEALEQRFEEAEAKARAVAHRAEEPLADIGEAARLLLEEIRTGYQKLRKSL